MLVGCFLMLNICVGVIIDNFSEMKKEQRKDGVKGNSLLMTESQSKWIEAQKKIGTQKMFLSLKELETYPEYRKRLFFFVNDDRFEGFIMGCIILNSIVLGARVYPSPGENYELLLVVLNYIFAAIFTGECILKIMAYHWNYFSDNWNRFDFLCVCATIFGLFVEIILGYKVGALFSAVRLFRVARLLRLLRFAKGLNKIFNAFVLSIPKLLNVAAILFLLQFLYGVMAVQLFAKIQYNNLNDKRGNFRTFYR